MKHFPIGFDDFAKLVQKDKDSTSYYHFRDKSLLIRDVLNNDAEVLLFTRPRRFGKTMNMSMLSYFFDIQGATQNRNLFTDLKVSHATVEGGSQAEPCMNYQGRYPVVFLTFKDCAFNTFEESYEQIKRTISKLYDRHRYLLASSQLDSDKEGFYRRILNYTANAADFNIAIRELTEYLYIHHNQKVIVLIDEYDAPFQVALYNNYYTQLLPIMRTMMGGVLKGNVFLEKAILTGILRISGAGVFSGAKTVLDHEFSEYFGFTEDDIKELLTDMDRIDQLEKLKDWYNGYQFGNTVIYNPWSVMECISQNFDFSGHWVNTSDDKLIKDLLLKAGTNTRRDIVTLVSDQSIEVVIYSALRFDEDLLPDEHLWTLLLSAGYLKSIYTSHTEGGTLCYLKIPNKEIGYIYTKIFANWLKQQLTDAGQSSMIEYLLTGQVKEFGEELKKFYLQTLSIHDIRTDYIEAFYHGFIIGIIGLSRIHHAVYLYSNRESGLGRYDLVLEPRDLQHPKYNVGIVLEFKRTAKPESLSKEAKNGLDQIKSLQYITDLQRRGVYRMIVMGIAFCGKQLAYTYEQLPISTVQLMAQQNDSPILRKRSGSEAEQRPSKHQKQELQQECTNQGDFGRS